MIRILFFPSFFRPFFPLYISSPNMSTAAAQAAAERLIGSPEPIEQVSQYPVPLTPPYPAHSKEVELRRAMSASARSAAGFELDVVFEDDWISVVNKPSGVYCDSVLSSLSPSNGANSSIPHLHLANRLDRDTSGLMVITKCNKAAAKLVKSFTNHTISKTYLALCVGTAPNWTHACIKSGHGRSKHGAFRVYSTLDVDRILPGNSRVKHMETIFHVLAINGTGKFHKPREFDSGYEMESIVAKEKCVDSETKYIDEIFIRAYPKSGRTHQIRLHCQYLGLPIKGDVKYGGVLERDGVEYEFHYLHAESLEFEHPITGVMLSFEAPLPEWAQKLVGSISHD
ncbi:hypothetical protein LUZ60_015834 [Juncus effusus]|nr:hypothetical protein LUZ60_015834 [Juncus effusus]